MKKRIRGGCLGRWGLYGGADAVGDGVERAFGEIGGRGWGFGLAVWAAEALHRQEASTSFQELAAGVVHRHQEVFVDPDTLLVVVDVLDKGGLEEFGDVLGHGETPCRCSAAVGGTLQNIDYGTLRWEKDPRPGSGQKSAGRGIGLDRVVRCLASACPVDD